MFVNVGEFVSRFAPRVCAHCGKRHDPPYWQRSLFRSWEVLNRVARLTIRAATEVRFAERVRATDPAGARAHLRVASRAIRKAEAQREIHCGYLVLASRRGTYDPSDESHVEYCLETALERVIDASVWLTKVTERLNEILPTLPAVPDFDDACPPRFLAPRTVSVADRVLALFKRRQRRKTAAPEDAPRRISRGRAPPTLELCTL